MKHWFGGLLSIALGVVLIAGGGLASNSATGGVLPPTCQVATAGVVVPCPTGTITVDEQTRQAAADFARVAALAPTPPASWAVTITSSNCTAPDGSPVDMPLAVPNNGSVASGDLFVYADPSHDTTCSYALAEAPVAGFTASFSPASPVTIPFDQSRAGSNLAVALTNTFAAPVTTTTPAPVSSPAPVTSSSSDPSTSTEPTSTSDPTSISTTAPVPTASSSAAALAGTGPREPVSVSLVAGIALCLLGLVLLVAGQRKSWTARHRS